MAALERPGRNEAGGGYSILDERPLVSMIVPGLNNAAIITRCVESILASRYMRMEVILVDHGSTDSTARIMAGLAAEYERVRFLGPKNEGHAAIVARGVAAALGDVVMLVDAEAICGPETVHRMLQGFDHRKVGAVIGRSRPLCGQRVLDWVLAAACQISPKVARRTLPRLSRQRLQPGAVVAFRSAVLAQSGGLNEYIVANVDLVLRVYEAGYRRRESRVTGQAPATSKSETHSRRRVRCG